MAQLGHYEFDDSGSYLDLDFDPAGYKTAGGAAKAFHKALQKLAEEIGYSAGEVALRNPKDSLEYGGNGNWEVVWEEGPYQWAVATALDGNGWWTEAGYSFSLNFYKN